MSTESKLLYISLQEIQFKPECFTDSYPRSALNSLIPQQLYQSIKYNNGEEKIMKAHALQLERKERLFVGTYWTITAYIVTLNHDESKMMKIKTEDMEKHENGKAIKMQGKKALVAFEAWSSTSQPCIHENDYFSRNTNYSYIWYRPQPSYKVCGDPLIYCHGEPDKGERLLSFTDCTRFALARDG
jgi:hypothetical protein